MRFDWIAGSSQVNVIRAGLFGSRLRIRPIELKFSGFVVLSKFCVLRWLKTVSSTFKDQDLMGNYIHFTSVDAKIMVSKNCPIIGEQVAVNFVTQ